MVRRVGGGEEDWRYNAGERMSSVWIAQRAALRYFVQHVKVSFIASSLNRCHPAKVTSFESDSWHRLMGNVNSVMIVTPDVGYTNLWTIHDSIFWILDCTF